MKPGVIWISLSVLSAEIVAAQTDFPGNPTVGPKKYTTRGVGGGIDPGASVNPANPESAEVQYVTHVILYDTRFWTNAEGKPLEAKLIAFEDLIATAPKGAAAPSMPSPPANPTLVRNGRIRLLVKQKAVEVTLASLSQQDQEFIAQIQAALAKKAAMAP